MDDAGPIEIIPPQAGQFADLTYRYPNNIVLQVVDRRLRSGQNVIPRGWDEQTSIENFGAVYVGDAVGFMSAAVAISTRSRPILWSGTLPIPIAVFP